jgi:hypothetical protein
MNNASLKHLGLSPMRLNSDFRPSEGSMIDSVELSQQPSSAVFIGDGLSNIWEIEESAEWQLLKNILNSFQIEIEETVHFDSSLIQTESAIQLTVDEVIATGVEQVYSFDEGGELLEYLQEGMEVIYLPLLSEQLINWQAKKSCYISLLDV